MAPWDAKLVVVGDNEDELNEAVRRLHRVGYKTQCLKFESWTTTKLDVAKNDMIEPQALYAEMQITEFPIIVDVRLPAEDAWLVRD